MKENMDFKAISLKSNKYWIPCTHTDNIFTLVSILALTLVFDFLPAWVRFSFILFCLIPHTLVPVELFSSEDWGVVTDKI